MEEGTADESAPTPLASNSRTIGDQTFQFSPDDDKSSDKGTFGEHERQIPERRLPDLAHQPSTFHLRNEKLSISSRLVRFTSDNAHIFQVVFDGIDDDSTADGDMGKDTSVTEEYDTLSYQIPVGEERNSDAMTASRFRRLLVSIANSVHRSPPPLPDPLEGRRDKGEEIDDSSTREFAHSLSSSSLAALASQQSVGSIQTGESKPLLWSEKNNENGALPTITAVDSGLQKRPSLKRVISKENRAARIAAAFLMDFERCRPCTLPEQVTLIKDSQLWCHWLRFSIGWKILLYISAISLFFASSLEGTSHRSSSRGKLAFFTFVPMTVFAVDIVIRRHYRSIILARGNNLGSSEHKGSKVDLRSLVHTRKSRSRLWQLPLMVLFVALTIETTLTFALDSKRTIWSSAFKPIAFFYISSNARDALEALRRVAPVVMKVVLMELFIILSFAAVATHLYTESPSFDNLSNAFLSLFELSTTVVNPSIWMPVYNERRSAATFFIFFIVTSVFYLHSLVLSVVFQTYIQAIREIRERSFSDREDALRLAFMALEQIDANEEQKFPAVRTNCVRETLAVIRPHYGPMKIDTLLQTLDPDCAGMIDYDSFRTKMPKALNTSLRKARSSNFGGSIVFELFAAFIAIANLIYVLMLSSSLEALWWTAAVLPVGSVLTILGLLELLIRLNPFKMSFVAPTSFSWIFDGLAILAGVISGYGIFLHCFHLHTDTLIEFLLMGRAVDMMRIMRFFGIFRDIVRRSGEVIPAISGPFILVFSAMHIFTYAGIALWGGAVEVGANADSLEPFYDLNNFNSYQSGIVTMFQVLVINDWHCIAEVFRYAKRLSDPAVIYPFFIGANLLSVSILLNVLTAFFVGAFVTRPDGSMGQQKRSHKSKSGDHTPNASEFHVLERQGFDKIMETVAGESNDETGWVRRTCEILEIFESLTPGVEKVGYLVCCSQSEDRFGNRRFQTLTREFFGENMMHMIVSEMHSELINSLAATDTARESNVQRIMDGTTKQLELSASLLSTRPPVSLFVARVKNQETEGGTEERHGGFGSVEGDGPVGLHF